MSTRPTLRLTQHNKGKNQYLIELAFEHGELSQTANVEFEYILSLEDQENIRWYLEDYLDHPYDPAPRIAAGVENRMKEIGIEIFQNVFQTNDETCDLWTTLRYELNDTRIELITSVQETASIPWELLREPKTDIPLALQAKAFVHTYSNPVKPSNLVSQVSRLPIRILLVICRPRGKDDVPFRSVAMKIVKGLAEDAHKDFQLDVLRPPTFEQLDKTLKEAKAEGYPYHVVHFDGHGTYENVYARNKQGCLLFESPNGLQGNYINGKCLGKLLAQTDVPVLLLNSCRSAYMEVSSEPKDSPTDDPAIVFGSLAQEVVNEGILGVLAMRYNIYVVTAAEFVAKLYVALAQGNTLGEAVAHGRKQLFDQPSRNTGYKSLSLQDWFVPVVYEAAPIPLFPKPIGGVKLTTILETDETTPERGRIDPQLPQKPSVGFFGRHETLLALDRGFDNQNIVLLYAYAGSGKTTTAAEFARWYAFTRGTDVVLFTTFERHRPLSQVLAKIEQMFRNELEQRRIQWLALDDEQRKDEALKIMRQIPILWIWDNVEQVAGFPTGTKSTWSKMEQQELVDFLRSTRDTHAKFLLTSRRAEKDWLENLPCRIRIPKMPMRERVLLAKGIAEKYGRRLTKVENWQPLLQFSQGNPLTITVLVGQALRDGLTTKEQIENFVAQLRAGEADFVDRESEGRSKSLGASLQYGFHHAFTEAERKKLALLHFYQGFVNVGVLEIMGHPEMDWSLPEIRNMTREEWIDLLDRAAEVGLLTQHGDGYYSIHPALPGYFKGLFEKYYKPLYILHKRNKPISHSLQKGHLPKINLTRLSLRSFENLVKFFKALGKLFVGRSRGKVFPLFEEGLGENCTRAFVETIGNLGDYYTQQYEYGNRDFVYALSFEEANLLHARQLAQKHGWWHRITSTMQGLQTLYTHTGRRSEWAQLVKEIILDFIDPTTDAPLPGREEQWDTVMSYRIRLVREAREWAEAERLLRIKMDWARQQAADALQVLETPGVSKTSGVIDSTQRHQIRSLAVSLNELGLLQLEMGQKECATTYEEALELVEQIDDHYLAAVCALNLGHAYKNLPVLYNLDQAEAWYRHSLKLRDERDKLGRSLIFDQIGMIMRKRLVEAVHADSLEKALKYADKAIEAHQESLILAPPDALDKHGLSHQHLGVIYGDIGDFDQAQLHYSEAIRYFEGSGNLYEAGRSRLYVAAELAHNGQFEKAHLYAQAALRNYQTYGDRAAADIQQTQQLIATIEEGGIVHR